MRTFAHVLEPPATMRTALFSALTILAAGCASAPASETEAKDLVATGAFTLTCADGTRAAFTAHDGAFDFEATTRDGATVLSATAKRPSLAVRLAELTSTEVHEYIELADRGLELPPSVPASTIELGLDGETRLTLKDASTSLDTSCAFDPASLLAYLHVARVDAKDALGGDGVKVVGFDVDDTLSFSTPAFLRGNASGATFGDATFWTVVNSCDSGCPAETITLPDGSAHAVTATDASAAKSKAKELVALHRSLGHKIYAITARPDFAAEKVRAYVQETFGIAPEDTFFEPVSKAERIASLDLDVFYGDGDGDIADAAKASAGAGAKKVQAFRFLRSPRSSNRSGTAKHSKYHPGYYGEMLIADSYE